MNLFILDYDPDRNAEYHIDKHVGKMQLEAAQLLTTALWVDKYLGYVPRALNSDELSEIKNRSAREPSIDERTFTRYLPTHHNHPCAIWVRSSLDNYEWTQVYVQALNSENVWRGNKSHASCAEVLKMPDPHYLPRLGVISFAQAMPDQYKREDAVEAYRAYYIGEKSSIASWKMRGAPDWFTEYNPYKDYQKNIEEASARVRSDQNSQ